MKKVGGLLGAFLGIALTISIPAALATPPTTAPSNVVGVRGEVLQTKSRWQTGHKVIVTDVTVRITETSQPDITGTLTFTAPGGELPQENLRMTVNTIPIFRSGQSIVVSLDRPRPDTFGKFLYRAHLGQQGDQQ